MPFGGQRKVVPGQQRLPHWGAGQEGPGPTSRHGDFHTCGGSMRLFKTPDSRHCQHTLNPISIVKNVGTINQKNALCDADLGSSPKARLRTAYVKNCQLTICPIHLASKEKGAACSACSRTIISLARSQHDCDGILRLQHSGGGDSACAQVGSRSLTFVGRCVNSQGSIPSPGCLPTQNRPIRVDFFQFHPEILSGKFVSPRVSRNSSGSIPCC